MNATIAAPVKHVSVATLLQRGNYVAPAMHAIDAAYAMYAAVVRQGSWKISARTVDAVRSVSVSVVTETH